MYYPRDYVEGWEAGFRAAVDAIRLRLPADPALHAICDDVDPPQPVTDVGDDSSEVPIT